MAAPAIQDRRKVSAVLPAYERSLKFIRACQSQGSLCDGGVDNEVFGERVVSIYIHTENPICVIG